ncbi:hypothetical protein ACTFIU_001132 [Dictyostelium citrinum]
MNNNLISNIKQYFLTNSNIQLNDNWLKDCLDHINKKNNDNINFNNNNNNISIISEKVYKYFLNSDILKSAQPCFTDTQAKSINDITIKLSKFNGVFILQLNSIKNISESFENRDNDDRSTNRTLKLHLTDGKNNFNAIEHHFIHFLSPLIPPGLKIAIKDFTVRRGIILLEEHNIRIIGGQVTRLVKIHEEEVKMRKDKLSAIINPNNGNNNNNSNINNRNSTNNNNNVRLNILPVNNNNKSTTTTSTASRMAINRTNIAITASTANSTPPNLIRPTIPLSTPSTASSTSTIRPTLPIKPSTNGIVKKPPLTSTTSTSTTTTSTTTSTTTNRGITKDTPISLLSPPQSLITNRVNLLNDNNENSKSTTTSKIFKNDHSIIDLDNEYNDVNSNNNNNTDNNNNNNNNFIINDKDSSFVTYISEINQKISIYKPKTKLNVLASIGGIKLSIKSGMFNIKLVLCDGSDSLKNVLLSPDISKSILGEVSDFRNLEKENQSKYLSDNLNLLANNILELEFQNQSDGFNIIKIKPLNEKILIEQLKNDISSFQNDRIGPRNSINFDSFNPYDDDNSGFGNYYVNEYDY